MADQLGSAVLTLSVDDSQFNAGLQRAQSTVQQVGGSLQAALGTLGVATSAAGIAAFVGNQVTQLDAAAAAVRTLGVDSQELGTRLRALSVELDNNISTLDLTKAAYDVASSGFSSAADATQILRASALGAKGGFAEVNDVASALTGVLNAYGLSASEATNIVDGFVQTQADGVITVRQYAAEIGNIASIAAASGVGIKELNAAIATATLRGVPVAQTFTGLRQALSSIIKPSEQAKELAESLGIQFNVGALQAKGLGGVLADVQQKTGGAADKIAILLGSVEAQAAVQPLLNDQLVKYNELLERQANAAGAAATASETNAATITGGLQQIGNGFSNLATTLDSVLSPLFAGFIKDINNVLSKLNQVAALAPDKVLARERQATDAVAGQLFPGQGSGFFGPISVNYNGKTYKGSATGVKESILQDLLKSDLAKINQAADGNGASQSATKPKPSLPAANEPNLKEKLSLGAFDPRSKIQGMIDKTANMDPKKPNTDSGAQAEEMLNKARQAQEEASAKVAEGFNKVRQASDALAQSQQALRSAQEGAFDLLTNSRQDALLNAARADLNQAVRAGFFDSGKVGKLNDSQLISAASQARAVLKADDALLRSQIDLVSANEALEKATTTLAEKDWNVKVDVNANSGDYAVNLG